MADLVSKKSTSVVSSQKSNDVVCSVKNSNNGLIDIDITPSNNQLLNLCDDDVDDEDDLILTNNTKNEMSAEEKSLQELIESELALRISSDSVEETVEVEEPTHQPEIPIKKIVIEPRQDLLDINAEFIGAEIDHYSIVQDPYTYGNGHDSPENKNVDVLMDNLLNVTDTTLPTEPNLEPEEDDIPIVVRQFLQNHPPTEKNTVHNAHETDHTNSHEPSEVKSLNSEVQQVISQVDTSEVHHLNSQVQLEPERLATLSQGLTEVQHLSTQVQEDIEVQETVSEVQEKVQEIPELHDQVNEGQPLNSNLQHRQVFDNLMTEVDQVDLANLNQTQSDVWMDSSKPDDSFGQFSDDFAGAHSSIDELPESEVDPRDPEEPSDPSWDNLEQLLGKTSAQQLCDIKIGMSPSLNEADMKDECHSVEDDQRELAKELDEFTRIGKSTDDEAHRENLPGHVDLIDVQSGDHGENEPQSPADVQNGSQDEVQNGDKNESQNEIETEISTIQSDVHSEMNDEIQDDIQSEVHNEIDITNNQTKSDSVPSLSSQTQVAPLATPDDESSDLSNSCDNESHEEVITTTTTLTSSTGTKAISKTEKKKIEGTSGDVTQSSTPKTKKTKKSKKSELEKENISVCRSFGDISNTNEADFGAVANQKDNDTQEKSSFNKFDALTKKSVLHVRSVDASKVQQQLNSVGQNGDANPNCRSCGKVVFQMEQTKAEGLVWHKNCFRCVQCSKQLNVDNYESNECILYCKAHFKELFQPKPVEESDQPASDKPDLGLEELSSLNVKSRFQVFEKSEIEKNEIERSPSQVAVKRSPSILSKLAKFQAKGMDIGVADDSLNGIPYEESSESEEEEEEESEETEIVKSKRTTRERPMSFSKMDDMKNRWEVTSQQGRRESQREAREEEIAGIRSRLFMGKQGKMKEMYQQAVATSEKVMKINPAEEIQNSTNAKSIKERFERGEPIAASDDETDQSGKPKAEKPDEEVIAAGISRKSRSLFLELDATAAKSARPVTPVNSKPSEAPRRARDANSPEREIYRDPDVIRADDRVDDVVHTDTARKMLSIFREMEEKATKEDLPDGPKPLKCFTPPPEDKYAKQTASDSEEDDEEDEEEASDDERDPNYVRASDKVEDEFLKQAAQGQKVAKAKTLRAKFEQWDTNDGKTTSHGIAEMEIAQTATADGEQQHSIESARSLRARFESLGSQPAEVPRPPKVKVNRFVGISTAPNEICEACEKTVYPLEKVETNNKIFHKNCFRCLQCNCVLRMDTFTLNNGKLYCIPHFKQLFIARGNYDEGFGVDPHKNKWSTAGNSSASSGPIVANGGATPVPNQV